MSSNFFFSNKSEQNLGNIDFTKIKSGLKKEDIQSSNQLVKSLFDLLDKNGDEVLNRNEIISLQNLLDEIDKDDDYDITEKEAGKIKLTNGKKLGKKNVEAFIELISAIVHKSESEGVVSVTESEEASEIITYNDGRVERRLNNGQVEIISRNGEEESSQIYDENGNIALETTFAENNQTITTYNASGNATTTELNSDGEYIVTQENTTTRYREGATVIEVDGRVTEEIFNINNRIIHYENGTILVTTNGNITTYTIFDTNNDITSVIVETYNQDGSKNREETIYDLQGNQTITQKNIFRNSIVVTGEKYIGIDGKEITLTYDESGNTSGIIVQNGETIDMIAERFGVNKEELIRLNQDKVHGQGNNRYFVVGENITIPGHVRANSEAVTFRNSAEEEIAEHELDMFLKEQARMQKEAERIERERQARMSTRGQNVTQAEELRRDLVDHGLTKNLTHYRINETGRSILAEITPANVIEFYKSFGAIKEGEDEYGNKFLYYTYDDYSLIDALGIELIGNEEINRHFSYLVSIAEEAGVPADIIRSYQDGFEDAMGGATTAECNINDIFYKFIAIIESYKYYLLPEELEQYRNKFNPENFNNEKEQVISNLELQVRQLELVINGTICIENYFENLPEKIRLLCLAGDRTQLNINDVNVAKRNIQLLKGCQSFEEFDIVYKRIFGIEYTLEHLKIAQDQIVIVFENMIDNANNAFQEQLGHDGFCADTADAFSRLWGSENTADKVREDLAKAREGLARLKACDDPQEFMIIYKEIFGVDFDYAQFIAVTRKQEEIELHREEAIRLDAEINFLKKYTGEQIVGNGTHEYYGGVHYEYYPSLKMRYDNYEIYKDTGRSVFEGSYADEGQYDRKCYQYVSPELFEADLDLIINYLGGREQVLQSAKQYYANLWNCPVNEVNISYEDSYQLGLIIDYIDTELRSRYDNAVGRRNQIFGGMSVEQAQLDVSNTLNGVLGAKNNMMTRVIEYNMSQQVGGEVVKGLFVAGAAILTAVYCPWLAFGVAVLGTPVIEAIDSMSTKNAWNAVGLEDFLKTAWEEYDGKAVLTNMAVNAVSMVGGMIAARLAITLADNMIVSSTLVRKLFEVAVQAQADIAIGLAADIVIHGEVTIDGVIYNATFAIVGNVISCVACKPKTARVGTEANGDIRLQDYFNNNFRHSCSQFDEVRIIPAEDVSTGRRTVEITMPDGNKLAIPEFKKADIERLLNILYVQKQNLSGSDIIMIKNYINNITSIDDLISLENLLKHTTKDSSCHNQLMEMINNKRTALGMEGMARPVEALDNIPPSGDDFATPRPIDASSLQSRIDNDINLRGQSTLDDGTIVIRNSNGEYEVDLVVDNGNHFVIKDQNIESLLAKIENVKFNFNRNHTSNIDGTSNHTARYDIEEYKRNHPLDVEDLRSKYEDSTCELLEKCYDIDPELTLQLLEDERFNLGIGVDKHDIAIDVNSFLTFIKDNPAYSGKIKCYLDGGYNWGKTRYHINEEINIERSIINRLSKNSNLNDADINELNAFIKNNKDLSSDILELSSRNLSKADIFTELESLVQTRQNIQNSLETAYPNKMAQLKNTLGEDFYNTIKWEKIFTSDMTDARCIEVLDEINEASKFFARTTINEQRYGKNFNWARQMNEISSNATTEIISGKSGSEVLESIAQRYGQGDNRDGSGVLRIYDENLENGYITPYNRFDAYPEYYERFSARSFDYDNPDARRIRRTSPYDDIELTSFTANSIAGKGTMWHGNSRCVEPCMRHIDRIQSDLQPLINKVQRGETLTPQEITTVHNKIAEAYFLLANTVPYKRGSNGICDIYMRSMYQALDIDMPALKRGVSLDLESFCYDLPDYQNNWLSFFDGEAVVRTDRTSTST